MPDARLSVSEYRNMPITCCRPTCIGSRLRPHNTEMHRALLLTTRYRTLLLFLPCLPCLTLRFCPLGY